MDRNGSIHGVDMNDVASDGPAFRYKSPERLFIAATCEGTVLILEFAKRARWLHPELTNEIEISNLLGPHEYKAMAGYQVGDAAKKLGNVRPSCAEAQGLSPEISESSL